jgi:hypothetical protein
VVSYHAPNGWYAANTQFFRTSGVDTPPLHALANGVDGPNGVFIYGSGGGFPTQTFNAANYWVDVVFTTTSQTWSISGTITGGADATVNLAGAATATTTADASGNYTFSGLAHGNYTVTPSKTGFTFTPANQAVTISGANATSVNFTAQAVGRSISGTITGGADATVSLTGAASATTTASPTGTYIFTGLANGNYTVTPTKTGYSITPANRAVTIDSANVTGINFTAQALPPTMDATASTNQSTASTTVTSPVFSTTGGNQLLLAFVAAGATTGSTNTIVNSVSGAGLTWVRVRRTNAQSGTSEIWRTFAPAALSNVSVTATLSNSVLSAITVVSFKGVNTSGTSGSGAIGANASGNSFSGAPTASLVTTRNNSWVLGVGNDSAGAIARTPGADQSLVHQYLTPNGNTFWVQMRNSATPLSGTSVTIDDSAPTTARYNLTICEIRPLP